MTSPATLVEGPAVDLTGTPGDWQARYEAEVAAHELTQADSDALRDRLDQILSFSTV